MKNPPLKVIQDIDDSLSDAEYPTEAEELAPAAKKAIAASSKPTLPRSAMDMWVLPILDWS